VKVVKNVSQIVSYYQMDFVLNVHQHVKKEDVNQMVLQQFVIIVHWVTILMELDVLCVQQLFKDVLNVTQVNNVLYVNQVIILICQIHVLNVQ
jgi:hypothetical protein